MFYLDSVSLIPIIRKGKFVSINKSDELSMVLDFIFQQVECGVNLYLS